MPSIKLTLNPTLNPILNPPIIAHRGASALAPENTFAAFYKAKEIGAKWVEFDVMLTADDEIVVIHDETLSRTTNSTGRVRDFSYHYLKTLDAGSWFDPQYKNEKIPTLKKVLHLLQRENLSAIIEIKSEIGLEVLTAKRVFDIVQPEWTDPKLPVLFSSFSLLILQEMRKHSKSILMGYLMDEWQENWKNIAEALGCVSLHVNHDMLTPLRAASVKKAGYLLAAYTVNDIKRAEELFSWGVDAVFSDCPADFLLSSELVK